MNVVVGQSGGPTTVINSSLAGVFVGAKQAGADKIYGMQNGIQGFLQEKFVRLDQVLDMGKYHTMLLTFLLIYDTMSTDQKYLRRCMV